MIKVNPKDRPAFGERVSGGRRPATLAPAPAYLQINYEDQDVLVIEKPAGIPCLPAKGSSSTTLYDMIIRARPSQKNIKEAGLVHRLDNDTSGVMLAAKTEKAYEHLREQFDEGKVLKEYVALVVGNPPAKGTIEDPIAHHPRKKKKMIVSKNGRPASTKFKVIKRFGKKYALLRVEIRTGVRHQIRVHLASMGFPIAGDRLYQNPGKRSEDVLPLKRHFLHASKIGFEHPGTNERIELSSILEEPSIALKAVHGHEDRRYRSGRTGRRGRDYPARRP